MPSLKTLQAYKWPTDEFPLATVSVRVANLATRLSLSTQKWNEDGWGSVEGFMCQTKSGLVFLIYELKHAVEHLEKKDAVITVDAQDFGAHGAEPLLAQVLSALKLSRADVTWIQDPALRDEALRRAEMARTYRKENSPTAPASKSPHRISDA